MKEKSYTCKTWFNNPMMIYQGSPQDNLSGGYTSAKVLSNYIKHRLFTLCEWW